VPPPGDVHAGEERDREGMKRKTEKRKLIVHRNEAEGCHSEPEHREGEESRSTKPGGMRFFASLRMTVLKSLSIKGTNVLHSGLATDHEILRPAASA